MKDIDFTKMYKAAEVKLTYIKSKLIKLESLVFRQAAICQP